MIWKYNYEIKLLKTSMLLIMCLSIAACGHMNVEYIDRENIKKATFAKYKPNYKPGESKPMRLGALHFSQKDANDEDQARVLLLQRKKGVYMAQTKLGHSDKKRYFISVGVNPQTQDPHFGFRMEF